MKRKHAKRKNKIHIALFLGATASVIGVVGTVSSVAYSAWTSTVTPPTPLSVSSGTVNLSFGTSQPDQLTVGASNLIPGDTVERGVELTNNGTVGLAGVGFGVSDASPTALVTGPNGLTATVASCSVPWTATSLSNGGYTYSCSGTQTIVMGSTSVSSLLTTPVQIAPVNSVNPGGVDYLVVALTLPSSAPSSDQGLSDSLTYDFGGVQKPATAS